jgi:hypothetical protein
VRVILPFPGEGSRAWREHGDGVTINECDGAAIAHEPAIRVKALQDAELVFVDAA